MGSKLRLVFAITILFVSFCGFSQSGYWQRELSQKAVTGSSLPHIDFKKAKIFSLQQEDLTKVLPVSTKLKSSSTVVYFPDENGELLPFQVVEAPVMAPELAAKYPQIRSYSGVGLKTGKERIRFSVSPQGVQSMIVHADGQEITFMQKVNKKGDDYVVYNKDSANEPVDGFLCSTKADVQKAIGGRALKLVEDGVLRKFRIAISATGEYTAYHGGTVADALGAINATITRINEVFETDLGITLELAGNTDLAIFTNATTDPYTGNLNTQAQNTLTNLIGEGNYDVGHLFHLANNGGNAGAIGSVCVDNIKGSGYAASTSPEGDIFDLDFVAHEIGHQFGANHTWSFEPEETLVQVEPASGTTIMGYAGITGNNDVATNGDDYFHYLSILQIAANLSTISCGETIARINNTPVISPASDYVIPKGTAFVLTGSATDPDADDVLTYAWEQIDDGIVTRPTFGPSRDSGANFRSLKPTTSPQRYFPRLSSVVQGNLTQTNPPKNSAWETVSNVEREMNFALTVRDNASGGGQVVSDLVNIRVVNGAGPFLITSQVNNGIYLAGSEQEIVWEVANTEKNPVNAQTVDIWLSVDGGLTFPIALAQNVPNDGRQNVLLPGISTPATRVMVRAANNVFFAVNTTDFSITESDIVLNFNTLEYNVCQPDSLIVPFTYETFGGFGEEVTFSATGVPVGLDVSFSPATATATNTPVNITFTNTGNIISGAYPIAIKATATGASKEVVLFLNVNNSIFPDVALLLPPNGSVDAGLNQSLGWASNPMFTSYDIEIAADTVFTTIVESATTPFNSYLTSNLEQNTAYFWRIKPKNSCGEGTFGPAFSFTTVEINCSVKLATDTPLNISNLGTPTVKSRISFFDDIPIADVNVSLDITHSFLADLVVSLTSPAGTKVTLTSNSCGEFVNINATFDDEGNNFVCGNNPAISGTIKPLGSLASFNGESTLGEWVLEVFDSAPSDGGAINSFSLEICAEGNFRPDADSDGVFDDGDDLCLGTPEGTEVNVQGCPVFRFPITNFSVSIQSESCRNSNNGSISISAAQPLSYSVEVVGNGTIINADFTSIYSLENLTAGTYSVCITALEGTKVYEEFCIEAIVSEPEPLSVVSMLSTENGQITLILDGASFYSVELNGLTFQTEGTEITLDLKNGENTLKVSTNIACQGIFEENIFISDKPILYPNPVTDIAKLDLGRDITGGITVEIFTSDGRIIKKTNAINATEAELDFTEFPSGIYFVRFQGENTKGTYKIIKK